MCRRTRLSHLLSALAPSKQELGGTSSTTLCCSWKKTPQGRGRFKHRCASPPRPGEHARVDQSFRKRKMSSFGRPALSMFMQPSHLHNREPGPRNRAAVVIELMTRQVALLQGRLVTTCHTFRGSKKKTSSTSEGAGHQPQDRIIAQCEQQHHSLLALQGANSLHVLGDP